MRKLKKLSMEIYLHLSFKFPRNVRWLFRADYLPEYKFAPYKSIKMHALQERKNVTIKNCKLL